MSGATWVVLADSAKARIIEARSPKEFEEIEVVDHPESRMTRGELVSDRPGVSNESFGSANHSMEEKTSPKKQEAIKFAHELAKLLDVARESGKLARLYLAAAPSFLGLLRQCMSSELQKIIRKEVSKDLVQIKVDEISNHFFIVLQD